MNMPGDSTKGVETARGNYQAAREEILERIRQRERVLEFYVGGSAAILAFGFTNDAPSYKSLVFGLIGYLSLAAAILVSQHNVAIESLAAFCREKVHRFLKCKGADAPQWDVYTQEDPREISKTIIRMIATALIIVGPAIIGLFLVNLPATVAEARTSYVIASDVCMVVGGLWTIVPFLLRLRRLLTKRHCRASDTSQDSCPTSSSTPTGSAP